MQCKRDVTHLVGFASVFFHKIALPLFHTKLIFQVLSFKSGILEEFHVCRRIKLFINRIGSLTWSEIEQIECVLEVKLLRISPA